MSDSVPVLYTYRYMWKLFDSKSIHFKIITDTLEGLKQFEESFLNVPRVESFGREYVCEFTCDKIGYFEEIFKKEKEGENNA